MAKYARTDRFGNQYLLVGCKLNKKGYPVGYAELGGKLYKIEPAKSNKDGVEEWIKITRVQRSQKTGI